MSKLKKIKTLKKSHFIFKMLMFRIKKIWKNLTSISQQGEKNAE